MIEVSKLIPHQRNNEFFDDIQGDNWIEFKKSIKTSGVIEPVIITQDYIIVSGHQRVRACKELNINEIPCEVKIYESEQQIIKDLLETNLRQRGIGNTNAIKLGRCIVELEKIYGIFIGNHKIKDGDNLNPKTQEKLAEDIGISQRQLSDYKKLLSLIPELQQLIETNQLSPTIGYKVLSKLSKEDQQKLINDFGKDYISQLTQMVVFLSIPVNN
jgi:ParB family chromosome partitioning protein